MRWILAAMLGMLSGLVVSTGVVAQSYALEMRHDCSGRQTGSAIEYPISNWDGQGRSAHSETVYDFNVVCGDSPRPLTRVFAASADSSRYELRGASLYMHVRDEQRRVALSDAERGCRMEGRSDWCSRTPDQLYQICRGNGLCEIEHSAYRCTTEEKVCDRPRTEYRHVPVWEPFPVGYAPLPAGARIVEVVAVVPEVARPMARPSANANTPEPAQTPQPVVFSNPLKDLTDIVRSNVTRGWWSETFGGVPYWALPTLLPFLLLYALARQGDFDRSADYLEGPIAAVIGVLFVTWLGARSGFDDFVLFCLFVLLPAIAAWQLLGSYRYIYQGWLYLRAFQSVPEDKADDGEYLDHLIIETKDTLLNRHNVSGFKFAARQRVFKEIRKVIEEKRTSESTFIDETTTAIEKQRELSGSIAGARATQGLGEEVQKTEEAVQTAELNTRRSEAEAKLAKAQKDEVRAKDALSTDEELRSEKLELEKSRLAADTSEMRAKTAYSEISEHLSEQARDEIIAELEEGDPLLDDLTEEYTSVTDTKLCMMNIREAYRRGEYRTALLWRLRADQIRKESLEGE